MSAQMLSAILESIAKGNESGRSPTIMIIHPGDKPVGGYDPNMSDDEVVSRNDAMIRAAARMRQGSLGGDDEGLNDLNDPLEDLEPEPEEIGAHGPTIGRKPNGFPMKAGGKPPMGAKPPAGKLSVPKIGAPKGGKAPAPKGDKAPAPKGGRK